VDVKRIVGFVLLGSALGIVFFIFYFLLNTDAEDPGDLPMWWGPSNSYSGLVASINDQVLVVDIRDGGQRRFKMDANTRVFLWGNQPVRKGVEVKVSFKAINDSQAPGGQYLLARNIRVLRARETPSPEATASPTSDASASPTPKATASPTAKP